MLKTKEEIDSLSFEWSVDYKPFSDDMSPQSYAAHGFRVGYERAQKEMQKQLQEMQQLLQPPLTQLT